MAYSVSRISNSDNKSLDRQESEIQKFADTHMIHIVKKIRCSGTAFTGMQPAIDNLRYLQNRIIIFHAVDRFSRNYDLGLDLMRDLVNNHCTVYFVLDDLKVSSILDPEWQLFGDLLKMAEHESMRKSQRLKVANQHRLEAGYATNGSPPFGYKKQRLPNGYSTLVLDQPTIGIKEFIHECKTPGTSIAKLNETLLTCAGVDTTDAKCHPIILDPADDSDTVPTKLRTDMTYRNIAELLNKYHVYGGPWTESKVTKVYREMIPVVYRDEDIVIRID